VAAEQPLAAIGLVLTAMLAGSAADAVSKLLAVGYDPIEVVWGRFVFVQILLLPFLLRPGSGVLRSRRPGLQVLRGVCILASAILFVAALVHLPIADATAIGFVSPLVITGLSIPLLGEKVGVRRWSAVGVGFIGVLIVIRPGSTAFNPAAVLPLLSATCWAVGLIITRHLRLTDRALTTMAYSTSVPLIATSVAVVAVWRTPSVKDWALMAGMGALNTLSHYLVIRGYMRGPASLLAPFSYSTMIWSTLAGYLLFDAIPGQTTWIGAAVVIASGLYVLHRERVRLRQRP
jgi:drug/metabolite transporter (DMT)-like permease